MMKNIYSNGVKQNIQYESSLLAYALLIDTVRSLHFGMPATIASSLADVPFPSQQSSFSQLLSATIFGFPKALWLPYSEENALLLLLLIFSEEQIWKTKMIHGTIPAGFPGDDARSNSLAYMKSIQRALNRWKVEYFDRTTSEIKALYQFCEIYLLLQNLENLPDMVKYREQHNGVPGLSQVHTMSNEEEQNRAKASHHAWLLLEHVSACSKSNAVWLPIILYLSGLVVWYDINSRQGSRSHGSMMVLNLFVKELRGMQWPCCIDMATNLEKLQ
ncbi:hypothetical protein BGW36DRAFT_27444 [Talaromyces proteolyticus]|uniref:Transcription factor domain-containing protein n=1 Tax=Talaromyces proteolyticus TaxID=1131652 RepID=A0AAD4KJ95_9EURO|nr:uncharacterized protein BGW36DRAFT_27444 [Talaromyces proteolyticus]KAH8692780.1 hypothetical protein BGW36DRAFT_27444 [Talaromyces proteolyticus]